MSVSTYGFRTAATALLLLTACKFECSLGGGNKIKGAKLAGFVREKLAAVGDTKAVECPDLTPKVDANVTCKVTFTEGPVRDAVVTATSDQGDVQMSLPVDLINREVLVTKFLKIFADQALALTKLECPPNQANVAGSLFFCVATLASGATVQLSALVPANLQLELNVTTPLFHAGKLSEVATRWARSELTRDDVTAQCGSDKQPVPAGPWPCPVTTSDGQTVRTLLVGLGDLAAPTFTWE
ncbi:MAG: DUF4333 domain-containing protein [Kofleriaceae bacterium]|nr:DUF4333 domain-containing protein [Kofleriaceae bacterium]